MGFVKQGIYLADMASSEKGVERWAALESNPEVLPAPLTPVP